MKSIRQVLLSLLCVGPTALWIIFMFLSPFLPNDSNPNRLFDAGDLYPGVFGKITITFLVVGVITALAFALRACMGKGVPKRQAAVWGIALVLGNVFVLPFFWFINIRGSNATRAE